MGGVVGTDGRRRGKYVSLKREAMEELESLGLTGAFMSKREWMKAGGEKEPKKYISRAYYATVRDAGKVPGVEFTDYPEAGEGVTPGAVLVAEVAGPVLAATGKGFPASADPGWFAGKRVASFAKCVQWAIDQCAFQVEAIRWEECPGPAAFVLLKNCHAPERQFELLKLRMQYSRGNAEGEVQEDGATEDEILVTLEGMKTGWEEEKSKKVVREKGGE